MSSTPSKNADILNSRDIEANLSNLDDIQEVYQQQQDARKFHTQNNNSRNSRSKSGENPKRGGYNQMAASPARSSNNSQIIKKRGGSDAYMGQGMPAGGSAGGYKEAPELAARGQSQNLANESSGKTLKVTFEGQPRTQSVNEEAYGQFARPTHAQRQVLKSQQQHSRDMIDAYSRVEPQSDSPNKIPRQSSEGGPHIDDQNHVRSRS